MTKIIKLSIQLLYNYLLEETKFISYVILIELINCIFYIILSINQILKLQLCLIYGIYFKITEFCLHFKV